MRTTYFFTFLRHNARVFAYTGEKVTPRRETESDSFEIRALPRFLYRDK